MMLALISHLAVRVPACHPPLASCAIMAKVCVRVWVCAREHMRTSLVHVRVHLCLCTIVFAVNSHTQRLTCFCR